MMRSTPLLNSEVSTVISCMGHTDSLVIADAGLPVPPGVTRIDLALTAGVPGFALTLETILKELCVEEAVIANEIEQANPLCHAAIKLILEAYTVKTGKKVSVSYVGHGEFKKLCKESRAVVRTGECTPYANIILRSGVPF